MDLFEQMAARDHEQVIAFQNNATGLRGFLAIHDTTLGPALGGVRLWPYASDAEALADALRLSRAMTYKASLAGLPCGGGKAVIVLHAGLKREPAFEAFGRMVDSLRGRFFTGRDVGITDDDLAAIARATPYVACESSPRSATSANTPPRACGTACARAWSSPASPGLAWRCRASAAWGCGWRGS